jgi:hypothetical protein
MCGVEGKGRALQLKERLLLEDELALLDIPTSDGSQAFLGDGDYLD